MGQQSKTNKKSTRSPSKGIRCMNHTIERRRIRAKRIQRRNAAIEAGHRIPSPGWLKCKRLSKARNRYRDLSIAA